jgi:T-complex protein 1 subunit beta
MHHWFKFYILVLRGSSKHILDEADRSFHDAVCVLVNTIKNRRVLYGGGNSEMRMASAVDKLAKTVMGTPIFIFILIIFI